jgi:hypothetical protein
MRKLRRLSRILTFFVFLIVVAFTIHESIHFYRFRHLAPLGLHADVEVSTESNLLGIRGLANFYKARLTNYSVFPITMIVCDYINWAGVHDTMVAYAVERWDPQMNTWEEVPEWDDSRLFCHPAFEVVETHLILRRLWPGQSLPVGGIMPAERSGFHQGDGGRFTIFLDGAYNSNRAISTAAFRIDRSAGK